jgi:hypothetical protein
MIEDREEGECTDEEEEEARRQSARPVELF